VLWWVGEEVVLMWVGWVWVQVRLVRERCKDKWAIRVSARDAGSGSGSGGSNGKGSVAAIERVAGSLAVTVRGCGPVAVAPQARSCMIMIIGLAKWYSD
jgi:hypothetical protein